MKKILGIAGVVAILAISGAQAATQTILYSFTATNISTFAGMPLTPPQTTVSGNFTVSFDDAVGGAGTISAINLTIDGHTYTPAEVGATYTVLVTTLLVGGSNNGLGFVTPGTDDFAMFITPALGATPGFLVFEYTSTAHPTGLFESTTAVAGTISSQVLTAVPEPATWSLMVAAFGAMGWVARRRRTVHA